MNIQVQNLLYTLKTDNNTIAIFISFVYISQQYILKRYVEYVKNNLNKDALNVNLYTTVRRIVKSNTGKIINFFVND